VVRVQADELTLISLGGWTFGPVSPKGLPPRTTPPPATTSGVYTTWRRLHTQRSRSMPTAAQSKWRRRRAHRSSRTVCSPSRVCMEMDVCYYFLTITCNSLAHHVRTPPSFVQGPLRRVTSGWVDRFRLLHPPCNRFIHLAHRKAPPMVYQRASRQQIHHVGEC
jgi:hypothetical protein